MLSGVAIAAFAAPVAVQTATVRGVAALTVPLNHHPTAFAAPLAAGSTTDKNLSVVAVAGAQTLGDTPAATGSSHSDSPVGARPSDERATPAEGTASEVSAKATPVVPATPAKTTTAKPAEAAEAPDDIAAEPAKPAKPIKPAKAEDSNGNTGSGNSGSGSSSDD